MCPYTAEVGNSTAQSQRAPNFYPRLWMCCKWFLLSITEGQLFLPGLYSMALGYM